MVHLLTTTAVNWNDLASLLTRTYKTNIVSKIDGQKIDKTLNKYLAALELIDKKQCHQHIHCGFLVICADYVLLEVAANCTLERLFAFEDCLILSGNLLAWQTAILSLCDKDQTIDVRGIGNDIYSILKTLNLEHIWKDYEAKQIGDGTFTLMRKT